MWEHSQSDDKKGGTGHTVVLAVLLAFPVVKVAWTVGGGDPAWEVLTALAPQNWFDVLAGMVRASAPLALVLALVVSRMSFLFMAARGAISHGTHRHVVVTTALMSLVAPVAFGILMTAFFDWRWGLATATGAWALRQGVILEYTTGHRGHRERSASLAPWQHRMISAGQVVATLLAVVVLPVTAFAVALDGESWTTVERCVVQVGTAQETNRLIELNRDGSGIVGWNLDRDQVTDGAGCEKVDSLVVRAPWWRS